MNLNLAFTRSRLAALVTTLLLAVGARNAAAGGCTITEHPQGRTVCANTSGINGFIISSSFDGGALLYIDWVVKKQVVGETTVATVASYTATSKSVFTSAPYFIPATSPAAPADYWFEFNVPGLPACSGWESQKARITILSSGLTIINQPADTTACPGRLVHLVALGQGDASGVTFRWTRDNVPLTNRADISGITGSGLRADLRITNALPSDGGAYRCEFYTLTCATTFQTEPGRVHIRAFPYNM